MTKYFQFKAKNVLKVDDDMFVNTYNVLELIRTSTIDTKTIICIGQYSVDVIRDPMSKWYVSPNEFSPEKYDTYCVGIFLLMSNELFASMNRQWPYVRFFWVDDYWMSAILGQKVNVTYDFRFESIIAYGDRTALQNISSILGMHTDQDINLMREMCNLFVVDLLDKTKNQKVDDLTI